jgi:hypothetical protein
VDLNPVTKDGVAMNADTGLRAIASSALCTRLRPLKWRAKERDCASSSRVTGRRWRVGHRGTIGEFEEHNKNI